MPLLHTAVLNNDLNAVKALKDDSSLTRALGSWGLTPLELAQLLHRIDCVNILDNYPIKDLSVEYLPYLHFESPEALRSVQKKCPYLLRLKQFEKPYTPGKLARVKVAPSEGKGRGLFANAPLEKGTWVGEYTGKVRRYAGDRNNYCFHYPTRLWSRDYHLIDALKAGNETRFINHSDTPNLVPECVVRGHILHTVFFTKRAIKKGEELFFDYGPDFW